jgi:hypothetical protein
VPALILGVVTATGAFGDFWKSYILAGSYYVMEFPEARLYNLRTLFLSSTDATPYFIGALAALALLAWACAAKGISRRDRLFWPLVIALTDAALTAGCLIIAGKPYWHYLSLLIPPLGLVCGLVFFVGKAQLDPAKAPERKTPTKRSVAAAPSAAAPRRLSSFSLWLLAFSVCVAAIPLYRVPYYARMTRYYISGRVPKPPVAELVARVSQPGDCMAVWGWMPSFFVETGLTPATRDAIGHYQLSPGPNQGYFRNRYLRDMQQSRPVLFVDAVARGAFLGPLGKAQMHEGFPELARYVDENYTLWTGVKLVEGDSPVRLYVLKERLARLGPPIANPGSLPRAE